MIKQWDIASKLNAQTASIEYTLRIDGTEQDAQLMAKKLTGYAGVPVSAAAPYTHSFSLPADLEENTLEQLRVAVREAVEQSQKIQDFAAPDHEKPAEFVELENMDSFLTKQPAAQAIADLPAEPEPAATPQTTQTDAQPSVVKENTALNLQVQSVPTELPDDITKTVTKPFLQKPKADSAAAPLDDILLAETRYDMFVDLSKLDPQAAADAAKRKAEQEQAAAAAESNNEADVFNIFEQKVNDQTAFIDLTDVKEITERISQKDLSFLQNTQTAATSKPATQAVPSASISNEEENGEVLDPFEQLLAASASPHKSEPAAEQPESKPAPAQTVAQEAAPVAPTPEPTPVAKPAAKPVITAPSASTPAGATQQPAPTASATPVLPTVPMEKKSTMENQGEGKTFLHLKRKQQPAPQPPAAPMPPAPQPPAKPAPAAPHAPVPKAPEQEAPAAGRTLFRRRPPVSTFLEKTRTIDHSIEMPLSELTRQPWPLEVPLIPTYTLENMTISINRFAHATAISVIENPGKLYNPLVLHGSSGTGKTHFLHAIGYALSKKYGQENVFITNGVRLSRGVQRYITEGNIAKFEEFTSKMKALLIDDIHLISVNEQNRSHLSKLLNSFHSQGKQIVITSKYPPENLAKLEELLQFKLDSGWISELKLATGPARMRIIQQMLANNGINIPIEDINRFFGHPNISLGSVARNIRRVHVLEKLIFPNKAPDAKESLVIFDQLLATKGEDQSSAISQKTPNDIHSFSVSGNGEWGRIGFFYPQHNSNMINWMLFALQQRAKELGIGGGPELAVRSSYSTENVISSAFKIANLCDNKNLKGAVILGPGMDVCEPSVRENFYDILTHMLEIMLIRCGTLNLEDVSAPSTYVKILSELLK